MANGTKEALADALRQMMKVKPIDKITVKDIAAECGINRNSFYYHSFFILKSTKIINNNL